MRRFWRDRRGVAALEFALVAPALFILIFGAAEFGILLSENLTLSNATIAGAQQFASSAGLDPTPYDDAVSAVQTGAPALNLTKSQISLTVNGTACTTNATCVSALQPGTGYVTVTTTYSCAALNIVFNLLPNCTLTSQELERVQ